MCEDDPLDLRVAHFNSQLNFIIDRERGSRIEGRNLITDKERAICNNAKGFNLIENRY